MRKTVRKLGRKIGRKIGLLVPIILLIPAVLCAAAPEIHIDPSFKFSTIETEHFYIHYHGGLEGAAEKASVYAEEAHCLMSSSFKWEPEGRTHIALVDNTDFANGLASVIPYNFIFIYPVPPMADMSLAQYDNYLKEVIFHEYVHILTLDPVRGYSKAARRVFGKTYPGFDPLSTALFVATAPPNIFMPVWWIEGIATWAETQYTSKGRGRSAYYEMFFRSAVAEDNFLTADKINGDIPYWPRGSAPYIYGLAFQRYIANTYGAESLSDLSIAHSGRVPFFIDGPPEALSGRSYEALYYKTVEDLIKDQKEKIAVLSSAPLTEAKTVDINDELLTHPRFSTDGRLAVNRRDPHGHEGIMVYEADKKAAFIRRLPSDHGISWPPSGDGIYFTQAELQGGYNQYQDIYYYDFEKGDVRRLTNNLRVKDVDVSPDGKKIALVEVRPESQALSIFALEGRELETLLVFDDSRLSGPRWSPDGSRIVFSLKDGEGNTGLYVYDTGSKGLEKILENGFENDSPDWSPDGGYIIFSSDMTGVHNLFGYSLDEKKLYQITNVIGGAFQPDVSPDGSRIVFSSYHSKGFKIADIDYNPQAWKEDIGPVIKPYWGEAYAPSISPDNCVSNPDEGVRDAVDDGGAVRRYSAFRTLRPRFWLPTFQTYEEESVIGAFTAGRDVLGYHTYALNAGYGLEEGRGYYDLRYIYDRYYPTLELTGYRRPDGIKDESGFISALSFPLRRYESNWRLILGYYLKKDIVRKDNLFAGIAFNNSLTYAYSVSPEEGRRVSAFVRDYSKSLGGDISSIDYTVSYGEFIRTAGQNVLYLNLKGGLSDGGLFDMGGLPSEGSDFPLRGYPEGIAFGKYVSTLTAEYRFPVSYILEGSGTLPYFLDRLHMAVFADAGSAWSDEFESDNVKVGAGAEARLDMVLGYKLNVTPAVGIAYGLSEGGEDRIYFAFIIKGI